MLKLLLACLSMAVVAGCARATPSFDALTPSAASVERLDKFELTFQLSGTGYVNPFDPAQIAVSALFVSPSHKTYAVNGFSFQDFTRSGPPEKLTPAGGPVWKVRFTPDEAGAWTYTVKAVDAKTGTAGLDPQTFTCVPSRRKGFVRTSVSDPHYLQFEDGATYVPVGQNMGWGNWGTENGTYSYDAWLPKVAAGGGNFARYWMWSDFHGIEWKETGLGDYGRRMDHAWRLDHDLDVARGQGVQVMLTLLNHGAVSTQVNPQWADSPYNVRNGGPCTSPRAFFSNKTARDYFKRRLRYIVARWGYASNLIWELANEIDNTDDYIKDAGVRADVADWHRDMAACLRSLDSRHVVTTSFSRFQDDPAIWNQPDIAFTQFHFYSTSPGMEDAQAAVIERYRRQFPAKPVFGGEMGFPGGGEYAIAHDPRGIHWHNAQWASVFAGAAGSSALWWWADYIEPQDLYSHYRGLSRFLSGLDLARAGLVPTRPAVSASARAGLRVTGYPDWGFRSESDDFTVSADGVLSPGEDQLAAYLYDTRDNAERHRPPTFHVDYPVPGSLTLTTGAPQGEPRLVVTLDGAAAYDARPPADGQVSIPVGPGRHVITLDNRGTGWVDVIDYVFTQVAPALKVYALQGPSVIAAWVMNRNHDYAQAQSGAALAPVGGTIHFRGLTRNGPWNVEWWDTRTGGVTGHSTVRATGGRLDLPVPPTAEDRAVRMTPAAPGHAGL